MQNESGVKERIKKFIAYPASVIMEWTGHSDYKAMKPYIKIVDAAKAENMARFDNFGKTDNNG